MAVTKACPYCGGKLKGVPASKVPVKPATSKNDYIWQCRGSCELFIFNHPLEGIDKYLKTLKALSK